MWAFTHETEDTFQFKKKKKKKRRNFLSNPHHVEQVSDSNEGDMVHFKAISIYVTQIPISKSLMLPW